MDKLNNFDCIFSCLYVFWLHRVLGQMAPWL
jgi:hypothetical protein